VGSVKFNEDDNTVSGGVDNVIGDDADDEEGEEEGEEPGDDDDDKEAEGDGTVADTGNFCLKGCREVEQVGEGCKDGEEEVVVENKVDGARGGMGSDEWTEFRSVSSHDCAKHAR
jgi:hypothetical protein